MRHSKRFLNQSFGNSIYLIHFRDWSCYTCYILSILIRIKSMVRRSPCYFFVIQYRPKLIGLVFKLLLWPKYSSYRIGIGVNRKIMNWGFQNTSNLLRLLIPGPRKLSFKLEGRNLKCTFYLLIKFRPSTFKLNFLRPDMSYLKKLDVFCHPQFMIFRLTSIPIL